MPKANNTPHSPFNLKPGFSLPPQKGNFSGLNPFQPQKNVPPSIDPHGRVDNHADTHPVGFTFSADLTTVTGMSDLNLSGLANLNVVDITNATFKTTIGLNDKNVQAVLSVQQKTSDTNFSSTHIYSDKDGDGQYTEIFNIAVAKVSSAPLEQQKFTFNTDGTLTATTVAPSSLSLTPTTSSTSLTATSPLTPTGFNGTDHTHFRNDANAVLEKVTLSNTVYVTETVANPQATGYHFEIFRDGNNDGTWTEIAHGETSGTNINTITKTIDLVGIQAYLADASAVVG